MDSSVIYMAFKHSHMALALLSLISFVTRSYWAAKASHLLEKKWVKICPHIIDTFLLLSAIGLIFIIKVYPFTAAGAWLTAKIIALVVYIIFATLTLKKAKTSFSRLVFFSIALFSFAYIGYTAKAHTVVGLSLFGL